MDGTVSEQRLPPLRDPARVSVVVPALGAASVIERAVASALDAVDVDQVVVAAGDPATFEVASAIADPRVHVVDNPSGRTPDALNAALAASEGDVIVRLDAHAELPPGYVARAVATLRRTGAANVGGRQVPVAERGFARAVAAAMQSRAGSGGATYRVGGQEGPTDTIYLGVFRREALDDVGGFDPRFTRNQDAELNLRLRRAGYQVWFDPELAVAYRPRGSLRSLASQYLQYGRWRRLTSRVHAGSIALRQLAAPVLVSGLGIAAVLSWIVGSWLPFGLLVGAYAIGLLAAALAAAPPSLALPTALALGTMHLAWGVGFLLGPPRGTDHGAP